MSVESEIEMLNLSSLAPGYDLSVLEEFFKGVNGDRPINELVGELALALGKNEQEAALLSHIWTSPKDDNLAKHFAQAPGGVKAVEDWLREDMNQTLDKMMDTQSINLSPDEVIDVELLQRLDSGDWRSMVSEEMAAEHAKIINLLSDLESTKPELVALYSQAVACQFAGLKQANKTLYREFCKQAVFHRTKLNLDLEQAHKLEAISEAKRQSGAKGRKARDQKRGLVKKYALELYAQGSYKSVNQAAKAIVSQVMDYSEQVGATYTKDPFQMVDNIGRWIRKEK